MSLFLKFYIFSCVFCFLCILNTIYILISTAKQYNAKFATGGGNSGSIIRLILIMFCPILNCICALIWLFVPAWKYEEAVFENCYIAEEDNDDN